jgi:hypothetical protein
MSYLDQWKSAWLNASSKYEVFNLAQSGSIKKLSSKIRQFDLLVVLHTVAADSNSWLEKLSKISDQSRPPMVMFIGNEFSSPFLSMESRLKYITRISPEFIATQLPIDCAKWLYEFTGSKILSAPPGLPEISYNASTKKIDLGYRGFKYPWYLLDKDRNKTINEVSELFSYHNKKVDISFEKRFGQDSWFKFLQSSSFTVSSEAGSRYVFRDDVIWKNVIEYFQKNLKYSAIQNDATGMNVMRRLPDPLKKIVKKVSNHIGIRQASLFEPGSEEISYLLSLINTDDHEYRDGKCISSRHLDAITCGTWQVLAPGEYSGILKQDLHFTKWSTDSLSKIQDLMNNNRLLAKSVEFAYESLKDSHTYSHRVSNILGYIR